MPARRGVQGKGKKEPEPEATVEALFSRYFSLGKNNNNKEEEMESPPPSKNRGQPANAGDGKKKEK